MKHKLSTDSRSTSTSCSSPRVLRSSHVEVDAKELGPLSFLPVQRRSPTKRLSRKSHIAILPSTSASAAQARVELVEAAGDHVASTIAPKPAEGVNHSKKSSPFRGVTMHRITKRFEAHLWDKSAYNARQKKKGKQVYLGAYDDEKAAAQAYDLAALKHWGPQTLTNFKVEQYAQQLKEMENIPKEVYLAKIRRKSSGFSRGRSKYRGVARHHHNGRWEARIGCIQKNKYNYLGTFGTEEEAAEAYDRAAISHRKSAAVTNFDLSRYTDLVRNIQEEIGRKNKKTRDGLTMGLIASTSGISGGGVSSPTMRANLRENAHEKSIDVQATKLQEVEQTSNVLAAHTNATIPARPLFGESSKVTNPQDLPRLPGDHEKSTILPVLEFVNDLIEETSSFPLGDFSSVDDEILKGFQDNMPGMLDGMLFESR